MTEIGLYNGKAAIGVGTTQMMLGFFTMIIGGQALQYQVAFGYIGYGLWGGLIAVISGIMTICTGAARSEILIVVNVVISILELLVALCVLAFALLSLLYPPQCTGCNNDYAINPYDYAINTNIYCTMWINGPQCVTVDYTIIIWDIALLLTLGGLSAVLALTSASLPCSCCRVHRPNEVSPLIGHGAERAQVSDTTAASPAVNFIGVIPASAMMMAGVDGTKGKDVLSMSREVQTEQIQYTTSGLQTDPIPMYSIHIQTHTTGNITGHHFYDGSGENGSNGHLNPTEYPKWIQSKDNKETTPTYNLSYTS